MPYPLELKDIIIGAEYEFCDPVYPEYWGHRCRVLSLGTFVNVLSTRDSDSCTFVPVGESASHGAWQLKPVLISEAELLFTGG
jgi:hypothetical protein